MIFIKKARLFAKVAGLFIASGFAIYFGFDEDDRFWPILFWSVIGFFTALFVAVHKHHGPEEKDN